MDRFPTVTAALGAAFWGCFAFVTLAIAVTLPQFDSHASQLLAAVGVSEMLGVDGGSEAVWILLAPYVRVVCVAVGFYGVYRALLTPTPVRSPNIHAASSAKFRALRHKHFPPGFANGWHAVCNASDLEHGRVHSIDALGTHMVAFRAGNGSVGVLDAFCPHLGAHLGMGGTVEGDSLRCPFHGWEFATSGACTAIPYATTKGVPPRAKTTAYPVREILGRVYVWFDAEGRPPQWELSAHLDLEEDVAAGRWYFGAQRTVQFEMHSCEMAMNSADPVHFQTLHGPFPLPVLQHVISGVHTVKATYGTGIVRSQRVERPWLTEFVEKMNGLWFFGIKWLPVPFAASVASMVSTTVIFEGPTIMHFMLATPLGKLRLEQTQLSLEPFKQHVESRWYAEAGVPRIVLKIVALIAARALEQDREVWENKIYRGKPMLIAGDGPFPAFIRWYSQFYSENSAEHARKSLEW